MESAQEKALQAKKQAIREGKKTLHDSPPTYELQKTSQAVNAPLANVESQALGTTLSTPINEDGDWTTVCRNKHSLNNIHQGKPRFRQNNRRDVADQQYLGKRKNPPKGGFVADEIQKAYHIAFKERRCFRCLSKSHKKAQCREPLRCFKCKHLGHQMGRWTKKTNPSDLSIKEDPRVHCRVKKPSEQAQTYAQVVKQQFQTNTEPAREMQMEPEPFADARPDERNVFTPAREYLRPQNEFLDRTAMIVMVQGPPLPDLPRDIARSFARHHGWQWQDYHVMPAREAPFLVICPGPNLKDAIVNGGVYTVRPGIQVRAVEWGIDLNMAYDPPPFEAWVKLTYLPLQAWNTIDLRKVTTEIGHITAIIPYGRPAGHYRHIILRVLCEDPATIPMHIKYHEGDLATRIRVRLLSWRDYEPGPFPLHIHNGNPQAPPPQPPQQPQQP